MSVCFPPLSQDGGRDLPPHSQDSDLHTAYDSEHVINNPEAAPSSPVVIEKHH